MDIDSDDELESPPRKKRAVEPVPDQPAVVVRTILYDIRQLDDIEPQILHAALDEWRCGTELATPRDDEPFRLKRYMAKPSPTWALATLHHKTPVYPTKRRPTTAPCVGVSYQGDMPSLGSHCHTVGI